MSALKITALARNVARLTIFQSRSSILIRQYATKIGEPPKKSSTLKLLLIGVSRNVDYNFLLVNVSF